MSDATKNAEARSSKREATPRSASTQRLLSVRSFIHAYGVGRTRVYELLKSGLLEGLKHGGRTLITVESADAWAASLPRFLSSRPEPRDDGTSSAQ